MKANEIYKRLSVIYSGMLFGVGMIMLLFYYFLYENFTILPDDSTNALFQIVGVALLFVGIPFGLIFYSKQIKNARGITDKEEKLSKYFMLSVVRFAIIMSAAIGNLVFFIVIKNNVVMYCAAIALLVFIFCKPNKFKMLEWLNNEE